MSLLLPVSFRKYESLCQLAYNTVEEHRHLFRRLAVLTIQPFPYHCISALIKEKAPAFTTFYPANAYTLLGLINLRQDRLNTARTLFKQAIDLENSQNRIKGAAIDYNNLAELALREGSGEEARTYLQQALSYAEMLEDEELKNYLKAKL